MPQAPLYCDQCGEEFVIDGSGIANHIDNDGDIDHEADDDHVPYTIDLIEDQKPCE